MNQPSRASISAVTALFLAGIAGAGAQGLGCAGPGHSGSGVTDPGADSGLDDATASTAGEDAGTTSPPAPPPQGIGIFFQSCNGSGPSVDWAPQRRISRIEYNNMVRDLLGDTTQPANGFPPETNLGSPTPGINLSSNTYAPPSPAAVQDYIQAAESIAESFVGDPNRLNNVVVNGVPSCGQAKDDTCAKDFIASFANRAYRGQLDDTESSGLFDVYSATKAQFDWTTGIQAVVTAVLSSPRFLYVLEFGSGSPSGQVVALGPYEIAARLALYLWRSVPDATLMSAAAAGQLSTAAQVQAQAQRMLTVKDSSGHLLAEDAIDDFTTQWMQLTAIAAKDTQYKSYNSDSALPQAMYAETRLDMSQAVLAENGTLTDVLTQKSSYLNSDLATFYGVQAGTGTAVTANDPTVSNRSFTKTAVSNRPGILTTAGVLATQAHSTLPSFVLRGKLVRENLLCDPIGNPPPNIPAAPTMAPDAGSTTRDLLLAHQQKGSACPGCHQYMDSIGEGFGNFDAVGQFQATDANGMANGQQGSPAASSFPAIDASGKIVAGQAVPGQNDPGALATTYTDVNDLTTQLAGAAQVRQCFALQELRYSLGRLETASDACSAQQIYGAFSSAQFNLQKLLLAIVGSDAFRYRSVEMPGSSCQ